MYMVTLLLSIGLVIALTATLSSMQPLRKADPYTV